MIGYTTLGTNDLPRAIEFYDALLGELGAKQIMGDDRIVVWGTDGRGMVAVCKPHDGKSASVGNGVMIALAAGSRDVVQKIYDKALSLGGSDEGPPGERGGGPFYGGYFRDLDGNKFVAFCMGK